jgi:hypothetical protein
MEITDNEYPLCPIDFRFNCASYEVWCEECGGCTGKGELHYIPVIRTAELATRKHPYLLHKKKVKKEAARRDKLAKRATTTSKIVKKALKTEKDNITKLGGKLTIASGRFNHDADGSININGIVYFIEHKQRFSEAASMFPTSAEYKKALDQGAKLFIVNSPKGNTITMSYEVFKEMLGL